MILITGANGQLGQECQHLLQEKKISFLAEDSKTLDITNEVQVENYFKEHEIATVFHCAAYTAVDAAEDTGKELNFQVNVLGTENIAKACKKYGTTLIYISTDYVFSGKTTGEYPVESMMQPLNEYGKGKALGETMVRKYLSHYYIIRTSWVFGKYGKNFVYTMLNLAKTRDTLTVVNDQIGRPTWTRSLAEFMVYIIEEKVSFGTYHFANDGICSWYDFATEILKDTNTKVLPVSSSEYPQKALRPPYSVLDLSKTKATGFEIISWQEALTKMMESI